jgi:hypothetical protein
MSTEKLERLAARKQKIEWQIERLLRVDERKKRVGELADQARILNFPDELLLVEFQKIADGVNSCSVLELPSCGQAEAR